MDNTVGITGYGAYVPRMRIKTSDIAEEWGVEGNTISKGLLLQEKSVPAVDEDTITLSVEAATYAIQRAQVSRADVGAVYIGSESHPYAVKPSGVVVAEALGLSRQIHVADYEFACNAGAQAMFVVSGLVRGGVIKNGLAIGADTSQGAPGDALEYSASAGAAAFLFGTSNVIASLDAFYSYTSDTPDFWRREGMMYPRHAGRFTGEPAYFSHVSAAAKGIMEQSGTQAGDFKYVIFHQPNGKFPLNVGKALGFTEEQMQPGRLAPCIGNTYSASSPLGLAATLDIADPGDRILMVSYGSGAGSTAFIFTTTSQLAATRERAPYVSQITDPSNRRYLDYGQYAKTRGKIMLGA